MNILNSSLELVALDTIRPHPRNPRRGDITALVASLETNNFYGYLVCDSKTRCILAGSHRWAAARQLGLKHVPVFWVDVSDEEALHILLVDNRLSDLGVMDTSTLAGVLRDLTATPDGLLGSGYDPDALAALIGASEDNDYSTLGDINNRTETVWTCPSCKGTWTE